MLMKKILLSFTMFMVAVGAWAQYVVQDGLRFSLYDSNPKYAQVEAPESGSYSGEITIPSVVSYGGEDYTVKYIGGDAFKESAVTKVTVPSSVTFILNSAFQGCASLTEVNLSEGLEGISSYAFQHSAVTSLTIPGTVTNIDWCAMEAMENLTKLTFAYGAEKLDMGWSVLNGTNNITELVVDRDYVWGNNQSISTNSVKKVTFGEHLTKIPEYACYKMSLDELNISTNITTVDVCAFSQCTLPAGYNFPFTQIKEIKENAFSLCHNLPANIDLSGVETIGYSAFSNSDVQTVKLGNSLTTFGESVFQYCRSLTTLNIPGTIDNLQSWWFYECTKLTNVTFDYGSTALTLEDGTFSYATNLTIDRTISGTTPFSTTAVTKVALGSHMNSTSAISGLNLSQYTGLEELELLEGFTTVPEGVFKNLASVTTLILPEGLEFIYANAFEAIGISAVTIPGTMKTIDRYAFRNCPNLTSVTLEYSENLTDGHWNYGKGNLYLNGSAFIQTNVTDFVADRPFTTGSSTPFAALKRATLGSHVTTIPERMFAGLTLEQLVVSENVTEVVKYAFTNCNLPEGVVFPFSNLKTIGNDAFRGCTNLPATINMQDIEEIGSSAFESNTNIQSLSLGSKLTTIGSQAFVNCSNLTSLTIADGALTEIGVRAFQSCNIGTFNMPRSITIIGSSAFYNNENLTIPNNLPEGLLEIGSYAFYNCKKLNVTIPSTVKTLGQGAFSGCESLTEVTIPAGVTSLGMSTFYGCTGLTTVTIPGTLLSMANGEFAHCDNLTEVKIEYGEESIKMDGWVFRFSPITNVYIDRNYQWTNTGSHTNYFGDAENVEFGPHVTAIPQNGLRSGSKLKSVTMTDNVTSIGMLAFNQAFAQGEDVSIKLSKNLQSIGKRAFYYCAGPQSITLPFSLQEIGEEALQSAYYVAEALKDIYVPWIDAPLALTNDTEDKRTFRYADNQTLWVPGGTMEMYKAADGWKRFQNFDYWSFVVTADVTGKGTLAVANGEAVTDNGTNTALSLTGAKLVEEGVGDDARGLFVREKDLALTLAPARGYEVTSFTANDAELEAVEGAYKVENLLADQALKLTFTPIIYNIVYNNLQDGTVDPANPATYTVEDAAITLVNPTRTGYNFKGWTGTDLTEPTMTVVIPANSIGNREYTAVWEPITYNVAFNANNGEGEMASMTFTYDKEQALTANAFTRTGYTFTGWNTKADGSGNAYTDKQSVKNLSATQDATVTLYAQWKLTVYNITYNLDGGTLPEGMTNPATYTIEDAAITLVNPERAGYAFLGWTGTDVAEASTTVTIAAGSIGDREFTATWLMLRDPADVNADGNVDVADIASVIDVMSGAEKDPTIVSNADVNHDGQVDVADIASVITRMAELARRLRMQ